MFAVFNLDSREYETTIGFYDDGAACADYCKSLNESAGRKVYQPRPAPAALDIDWRAREQARIDSGHYLAPLPEILAYAAPDHFLHVSKDKPELLAYTANTEKGARDIQTRVSVIGYLEKFAPAATQQDRESLAALHAETFAPDELKFAITADDMESVYTNFDSSVHALAQSCMRHAVSEYHDECPEHPVRVYATDGGPDHLAIAYLQNASGETIARALCYPAGKVYSRVYGADKLHALLKARGYKKGSYYQSEDSDAPSMYGARLDAIHVQDDVYLMPYIDGPEKLKLEGDHFTFAPRSNGDYDSKNTNGLSGELEDENQSECENCGDSYHSDDGYAVYTYFRGGDPRGEQLWCVYCAHNHAFYCHGCNERISDSDVASIEMNQETYALPYAEANFRLCEHTNEWFDGAPIEVTVNSRGHTESWSPDAADENAFISRDGDYYANKLRHPDSPDDEPYAVGDEPDDDSADNFPANPDENQLSLAL